MSLRLRQVALVARDLEPTLETLQAVLGIEVSFRDPGVAVFSLVNGVMPIGDTFLEVVSPTHESASAARYLQRRGGDGGYMVIFQCEDVAAERERLGALGVRVVWEAALEDAQTVHLDPRAVGGAIVSIDAMQPYDSWRWAGPGWQDSVRTERVRAIRGVTIQALEPQAVAERWSEVLGYELDFARRRMTLSDGSFVEFVRAEDGRGDGVSAVHVAVNDRQAIVEEAARRNLPAGADAVEICGTRFVLA
ncbi:MAG TPA: VOC family protein [Candidatus Limnocylindrales bacterium]|nr:VOC family protein [Candidatus Limnocylindrales bacterium]